MFGTGYILSAGALIALWLAYRKMAKAGSPFFKIGYFLYTRTPVGYYYYRREVSQAATKYNNTGHSITEPYTINGLQIYPIPMSMDNYCYVITDEQSHVSVLVDPADPDAVQPFLDKENITPIAVLTTHKHWDHSGGNKEWRRRYRNIRVYGGATDNVPGCTNPVADEEVLEFGQLVFNVHLTPGHTSGHVVYVLDGGPFGAPRSLFSGDHLFLGGMGRMFEANARTMLQSLDTICNLPGDTLVWPGHEYAVDNLEFAAHIDPENEHVLGKLAWSRDRRKGKQQTCPSSLAEELQYNPFLRSDQPYMHKAVGLDETTGLERDELRAKVLFECRKRKDKFKYKL